MAPYSVGLIVIFVLTVWMRGCYSQMNETAHAACLRDSSTKTLKMKFRILRGPASISTIYQVYAVQGPPNYLKWTGACTIDTSSVAGQITSDHSVNIDDSTSSNGCGFTRTTGTNKFQWRFRTRTDPDPEEKFTTAYDSVYIMECDYNTATDVYLSTSVEVLDVVKEQNAEMPTGQSISLIAVDSSNNQVTSGKLGDFIKLETILNLGANYQDNAFPYGCAPYNCLASADCTFASGFTEEIILSNGCSNTATTGSSVLLAPPGKGFSKRISTVSKFHTTTEAFPIRTWTAKPEKLCFSCYVHLCFGTRIPPSDSRCENFCDNPSRKKRETDSSEGQRVVLELKIDYDTGHKESSDGLEMTVIVLIAALVTMLIAISAIICFIFFFLKRRGTYDEDDKTPPQYMDSRKMPDKY